MTIQPLLTGDRKVDPAVSNIYRILNELQSKMNRVVDGKNIPTGFSITDGTQLANKIISVNDDLLTHEAGIGTAVHGLGTASTHADTDFAPAGAYLTGVVCDAPLGGAGTALSHLTVDLSSKQAVSSILGALAGLNWTTGTPLLRMTGAAAFSLDTATYLTTLAGAVLTDQTVGQTIGATGARLTKLWTTDITCTNAIAGSVTGNAGTVTGLSFASGKSLTVNNIITLSAAADSNALNIGSGGTLGTAAFTAATAYDASGAAAGAVSAHASLQTGVHGISITAAKVLTVSDSTTLANASITLANTGSLTLPAAATTITGGGTLGLGGFTLTVPQTGTAIVKNSVASGSVAAGWWRFAQSNSLPCQGIFKIKYYRGTALHSMMVHVSIFDGASTPNITILTNTLGT